MSSSQIRLQTVRVPTESRVYPYSSGAGALRRAGEWLRRLCSDVDSVVVVSSPAVWALWGQELTRGLRRGSVRCDEILMDDRERAKRLRSLEGLADVMHRLGADRRTILVAFGGGVVGDVAGFTAATFMRGIDCVQIPTTVVAQVDSAIGGKTGVNLASGKNLIGSFHQPVGVLADPLTLHTLPQREFGSGLFEVVKSAVIGDAKLFAYLERNLERVKRLESAPLRRALSGAARVKIRIVTEDETEQGPRRILNLGHTFAHAWETLAGYRRLRHGEAVGWGMLAATMLAERLCVIGEEAAERICSLVASTAPLPQLPRAEPGEVFDRMLGDKKTQRGRLHLVLPFDVGDVRVVTGVPRKEVVSVLGALSGRQGRR